MTSGKLVRDKIPDIIRAEGKEADTVLLEGEHHTSALHDKMAEEWQEYRSAPPAQKAEELADVLEVVFALAARNGIAEQELLAIRAEKREKRGGFDKGLFLKS